MFNNFFPKIVPFMRYCGKTRLRRQATDDNTTGHMYTSRWISKATDTNSEFVAGKNGQSYPTGECPTVS
jgi:hypothetical protein